MPAMEPHVVTVEPAHPAIAPGVAHHRNVQGGWARAAVFGISDGLLTNVAFILGVAGAHMAAGQVRLAGLAGLVGGAVSMASGEYVSVSAQTELIERELDMEREALRLYPEVERRELAAIYRARGLTTAEADRMSAAIMENPEVALEVHAREELGVDPSQTGAPLVAAGSSFVAFAIGALIPLLPWFFVEDVTAVWSSVALVMISSVAVGWILAGLTGRSRTRTILRQAGFAVAAAAVTYVLGSLVGTHVG